MWTGSGTTAAEELFIVDTIIFAHGHLRRGSLAAGG
jgi:hypothetical protein